MEYNLSPRMESALKSGLGSPEGYVVADGRTKTALERRGLLSGPKGRESLTLAGLEEARTLKMAAEVQAYVEGPEPEGPEPEVTGEAALGEIGGCWAGGALTGKALEAYAAGDYAAAVVVAQAQKALQGEKESAGDAREMAGDRLATVETLGDVAAEVLDLVADGQTPALAAALVLEVRDPAPDPEMVAAGQRYLAAELKVPTPSRPALERDLRYVDMGVALAHVVPPVEVRVAPMGTPEPTAEDLSDLAQALAAEDLETLEPEEVRAPKETALRCQPRDVVTIHKGDRLYLVERVEVDASRSAITGEVTDHTMALVTPVDPEDLRDPQWVHVDLLHVRRPVARVTTEEITGRVRQTREVFKGEGPGFYTAEGDLMAVRTILMDSRRLPVATLAEVPSFPVGSEATLRVGEALVVDGRCYAVELGDGLEDRAELVPAPHRDRLKDPVKPFRMNIPSIPAGNDRHA